MKVKPISHLEQEVMAIVWDCGDCAVRDVLEKISKEKNLAYTTVATILQRLHEKGLVKRTTEGSLVHYSPKVSKESYTRSLAQSILQKFISSFGDTAIASFAESVEKLPKNKKEYLLKLLSEHETK